MITNIDDTTHGQITTKPLSTWQYQRISNIMFRHRMGGHMSSRRRRGGHDMSCRNESEGAGSGCGANGMDAARGARIKGMGSPYGGHAVSPKTFPVRNNKHQSIMSSLRLTTRCDEPNPIDWDQAVPEDKDEIGRLTERFRRVMGKQHDNFPHSQPSEYMPKSQSTGT